MSIKVLVLKLAVTVVAALIVTVQVLAVPVHPPPLHPANVEPEAAAAVSTTDVPLAKGSEQSAPQLIPVGALVTVPVPVPAFVTARANC
ncbi:MAG: hypothetical protein HYY82_19210 [Deltaproteobacteria bacterium]|nr:hypothetical protein [Deltaproteobacteria bacterium]